MPIPLSTHTMTTRSKSSIVKPKLYVFHIHGTSVLPKPKSYKEASKIPEWHKVIELELQNDNMGVGFPTHQ